MTPLPLFARRRNKDLSIDSICTSCFLTIATVRGEGGDYLTSQEQKHICDPYGEFTSAIPDSEIRGDRARPQRMNLQAD
jgi:hypothetical protein